MQRSHRATDSTQGWYVGGWKAGQARLGKAQKRGYPPYGDVKKEVSSVRGEALLYCQGPRLRWASGLGPVGIIRTHQSTWVWREALGKWQYNEQRVWACRGIGNKRQCQKTGTEKVRTHKGGTAEGQGGPIRSQMGRWMVWGMRQAEGRARALPGRSLASNLSI